MTELIDDRALFLKKMAKIAVELDEKGYAVIPKVFHETEVYHMKNCAYRILKPKENQSHIQWKGKHPALFFWPSDVSAMFNAFAIDIRLQSIVRFFLGDEIRWLNNQIYYREPGDGDEFAWHQDICFRTPAEEFKQIETGYLQTVIVLDPQMKTNGAIEFIPGSHKWGNMNLVPRDNSEAGLRKFVRGDWKGEKVLAEPGDVMIWNVMTVHGSEQNKSKQSRAQYMNGFASEASILNKKAFKIYPKVTR